MYTQLNAFAPIHLFLAVADVDLPTDHDATGQIGLLLAAAGLLVLDDLLLAVAVAGETAAAVLLHAAVDLRRHVGLVAPAVHRVQLVVVVEGLVGVLRVARDAVRGHELRRGGTVAVGASEAQHLAE